VGLDLEGTHLKAKAKSRMNTGAPDLHCTTLTIKQIALTFKSGYHATNIELGLGVISSMTTSLGLPGSQQLESETQ
jgi:hypothetical protein